MDRLIEKIRECNNPTAVGLDTSFDYLPENMTKNVSTLSDAAKAIEEFNYKIIDRLYKIVPAVKVQVAYYEMYGIEGMIAFKNTLDYAKSKNLIVIADVKRNDIGSTADCYSKAYLGNAVVNGKKINAFYSDLMTVNGYLGIDGIEPFIKDCTANDKGIFVLCKTSNPSSSDIQNLVTSQNKPLYEVMGGLIEEWGSGNIGKYGYSRVGAVVGATHPKEAEILRQKMKHTMFLVPGYGAQGGTSADLKPCFDKNKEGAIVNNSRGIICAYKKDKYKGLSYFDAAYEAAIEMREDIIKAL